MTYVFQGSPIQPAAASYISYTVGVNWTAGENLDLYWPFAFTSTGNPVCTTMTFISNTDPGTVILPKANEASPGQAFYMWNLGTQNIVVQSYGGAEEVATIATTEAYYVVLTNNETEGGEWLAFEVGADGSPSSASYLAGYGLKALNSNPPGNPQTLNVAFQSRTEDASFTLNVLDWGYTLLCTSLCEVITLPVLTTAQGSTDGYMCFIYNSTGNLVELTPSGDPVTINGQTTAWSMLPGTSCILQYDGTSAYTTIGLQIPTSGTTSLYVVDASGTTSQIDLTQAQLANEILDIRSLTAPLTQDVTIYLSNFNNQWIIQNNTFSAYKVYLRAGSPTSPSPGIYSLGNGVATYFYVNASDGELYSIDTLRPIPSEYGSIPISMSGGDVATQGLSEWGGVAVIENQFANNAFPLSVTTLNETVLSVTLDNIGIGVGAFTSGILIQGVIYVSPAISGTETTTITIQKSEDSGPSANISTQGSVPLWSYVNTATPTYQTSDLIAVPFMVKDVVNNATTNVIYTIYASVTGGTASINQSVTGGLTGVSTIFATAYSATGFQ